MLGIEPRSFERAVSAFNRITISSDPSLFPIQGIWVVPPQNVDKPYYSSVKCVLSTYLKSCKINQSQNQKPNNNYEK